MRVVRIEVEHGRTIADDVQTGGAVSEEVLELLVRTRGGSLAGEHSQDGGVGALQLALRRSGSACVGERARFSEVGVVVDRDVGRPIYGSTGAPDVVVALHLIPPETSGRSVVSLT